MFVQQAWFLKPVEKFLFLEQLRKGEGRYWKIEDFANFTKRGLRTSLWDPNQAWERAGVELGLVEKGFFSAVMLEQRHYPKLLRELYDPPFLLYYRGDIKAVAKSVVAMVGTRMPSGNAASAAFRLGKQLGEIGSPVVSGLARGIDSFSHAGNHKAGVGSVAVLGCGIDIIYPPCNRALASELLDKGGVIISEYPPGVQPATFRFPQRNRIISGLSYATVVVQAPKKSGALITADFALEQGREVFVVKEGLSGERGKGCANLMDSGASVIENIKDLTESIRLWK